jgi:hypothetical protein
MKNATYTAVTAIHAGTKNTKATAETMIKELFCASEQLNWSITVGIKIFVVVP